MDATWLTRTRESTLPEPWTWNRADGPAHVEEVSGRYHAIAGLPQQGQEKLNRSHRCLPADRAVAGVVREDHVSSLKVASETVGR
jgi:hypothetical protein